MFELIIKCSKDVKKLVIDFGDSQSTMEVTDQEDFKPMFFGHKEEQNDLPSRSAPKKDMSDILAERASATTSAPATKSKPAQSAPLPTIDLANRPPIVDEDMQKGF